MKNLLFVVLIFGLAANFVFGQVKRVMPQPQRSRYLTQPAQLQKTKLQQQVNRNFTGAVQLQKVKLQLPGDGGFKDYYVNQVGDNYILNGDIVIPISPSARQVGVMKTDQNGVRILPGQMNVESYTADDKHFMGWTVKSFKWPNGQIPVEIDQSVYDTNNCLAVKEALDYINANTLLIFYPRKNEDDYVSIVVSDGAANGAGGNSFVGKQGGKQIITLLKGRFNSYTLVHELMHSAGVFHEQSRSDRDNYISIDISNVIPGAEHNFQIEGDATAHGNFDYCSIMQYPSYAFAVDPTKPVITCRSNGAAVSCPDCMGKQAGLSSLDSKGISDYYGQIGVSRFPSGGSFPMACGQQWDITQQIIRESRNPPVYGYTGGVNEQNLASPSPGNPADGQGYFMPGKQNNSWFYYSLKTNSVTDNGGAIRDKYLKEGAERAWLGWPEISQTAIQGGVFQRFNHGSIYWNPNYGAFVVKGAIIAKWAAIGWEKSPLGWPETDEIPLAGGAFQRFNHGHIYWTPKYGAFVVTGAIFDAWAKQNWEKGTLGYPVSDYISNNQPGNKYRAPLGGIQNFEHGFIQLNIMPAMAGQSNVTASVHIYSMAEEIAHRNLNPNVQLQNPVNNSSSGNSKYNNVKPVQMRPGTARPLPGSQNTINPQPLPPKIIKQN
jgi:hypothetical protein